MTDRKHLTAREIEKLIAATKGSRNEPRDRCLLLLMFRHGLRVSEALGLTTADLEITAHPHMLRHACGFALADEGADTRLIQDYLGHRNIQHTVRYTATNPARLEKLWR